MRYPKEMLQFVIDNCDNRTNQELAELVNEKFGTDLDQKKMKCYMGNHKLRRKSVKSKAEPDHSKYFEIHGITDECVKHMRAHYKGCGPLEMSYILNDKYGTKLNRLDVKHAYRLLGLNSGLTGRFGPGHKTNAERMYKVWNHPKSIEHRFQKGHASFNSKPVGTELIGTEGYWLRKVANPRKWKLLHVLIWEEHNGPVPEGHKVIFKDGNKLNLDIDNLVLVTAAEHCTLNFQKMRSSDPDATMAGLGYLRLKSKIKELEKRKIDDGDLHRE